MLRVLAFPGLDTPIRDFVLELEVSPQNIHCDSTELVGQYPAERVETLELSRLGKLLRSPSNRYATIVHDRPRS
jgi:hypothetical protein